MRWIVPAFCMMVAAEQAEAGAWSREDGQFFVAAGANLLLSSGAQLPVHYDPTLYIEYGLSDRVTVGLDYHTADQGEVDTAFAFARFPLGDTAGRNRFAASLAFGIRMDDANPDENLVQGGVSWGRGLDRGWLALDYSATYGDIDQQFRSKADFSWGHDLGPRWTSFLQLQTGEGFDDDVYAKISPAMIYRVNDTYRVSLGGIKALTGDEGSALKLDIWATF